MHKRGRFLVLEGIKGAGKSTHAKLLTAHLGQELGAAQVISTREPGGCAKGDQLRALLLHNQGQEAQAWLPISEALLIATARHQHCQEVIVPACARGCWVVCDRFFLSTLAYQGAGRGVSRAILEQLQAIAAGDLRPDLTIILEPSWPPHNPTSGLLNGYDHAFSQRVARAYQAFTSSAEGALLRLSVAGSMSDVHARLWQDLQARFPELRNSSPL